MFNFSPKLNLPFSKGHKVRRPKPLLCMQYTVTPLIRNPNKPNYNGFLGLKKALFQYKSFPDKTNPAYNEFQVITYA